MLAASHCGSTPRTIAARWYESYGALPMLDAPLSLVLPLATAADALKRGN
jgi:hypothetical protein